jgi:hypothetical protein
MAIRERAWDCPACGRKGNRGPEKFCGSCGSPRGKDIKFYLPCDARVVTDEEELRKAKSGPDWNCSFCSGDNPSSNSFCSGCGASKDGAPSREVIEYRTDTPQIEKQKDNVQADVFTQGKYIEPPGDRLFKYIFMTFFTLILLTVGGLFIYMFVPWYSLSPFFQRVSDFFYVKETTLTVTGFSWDREINFEKLKSVKKEAWEHEEPADAKIISSHNEIHHYDKVLIRTDKKTRTHKEKVYKGTEKVKVGVKDLGNGYFEDIYEDRPVYEEVEKKETYEEPVYEDKPVYKKKIIYEVIEWTPVRKVNEKGDDQKAFWPSFTMEEGEREGGRYDNYCVFFTDQKGNSFTYKPGSETEWMAFQKGQTYKARVSSGEIREIIK